MGIGVFSFKLVVVDQLDSVGVAIRKAENNPPVGSHRHRPEALHIELLSWCRPPTPLYNRFEILLFIVATKLRKRLFTLRRPPGVVIVR